MVQYIWSGLFICVLGRGAHLPVAMNKEEGDCLPFIIVTRRENSAVIVVQLRSAIWNPIFSSLTQLFLASPVYCNWSISSHRRLLGVTLTKSLIAHLIPYESV